MHFLHTTSCLFLFVTILIVLKAASIVISILYVVVVSPACTYYILRSTCFCYNRYCFSSCFYCYIDIVVVASPPLSDLLSFLLALLTVHIVPVAAPIVRSRLLLLLHHLVIHSLFCML